MIAEQTQFAISDEQQELFLRRTVRSSRSQIITFKKIRMKYSAISRLLLILDYDAYLCPSCYGVTIKLNTKIDIWTNVLCRHCESRWGRLQQRWRRQDDCKTVGTVGEQLCVIARLIWIFVAHSMGDELLQRWQGDNQETLCAQQTGDADSISVDIE